MKPLKFTNSIKDGMSVNTTRNSGQLVDDLVYDSFFSPLCLVIDRTLYNSGFEKKSFCIFFLSFRASVSCGHVASTKT
jgi:hypothetical protein